MIQQPPSNGVTPDLRALLSAREDEVLHMTSLGLTNAQVAERLGVTVHGVKFHLASIYRKLGVANRTEAAVRLLEYERGSLPRGAESTG